jgi:hypothetical protein
MTLKAKELLIIFFVLFGFSSFSVAQDFVFTSQISKTTGEKVYEVQINEDRVLNSLDKGEQLTLELDGSSFLQTIKGKNKVGFGYTAITGHPKKGNSYSNLLLKEGKLSGIIHFEGIPYRIQAKNGDYQLFRINDEIHACSFDELPMNRASQQKSFLKAGGEYANPVYDIEDYNDTTTVDVLVLYTSRAKEWASGANNTHTNDIQEIFALNESFKNNIISNSKLTLKIRFLDHIEIANTPENNSLNKLNDLVDNTYTGNPDTVDIHSLRDQFGADLVALVDSINDTGGIAYRPNGVGGSPSSGYSVNRVQQIGFSYTLMHEIGHNFGNAHGRTQNSNAATDFGGIFQFSTGNYLTTQGDTSFNTVMHYGDSNSTDIPYFSNPRVEFRNTPTGTYSGTGGPSDNVLSMSITKKWIAEYKNTVIDPASIVLNTTAIEDTVFPSGISKQKIIIENTGDSDLEIKLDGEMDFVSHLKRAKNIKQPLNLTYGFEKSEGFHTGSYTGYNNWTALDDQNYEISSARAATGSQSLYAPQALKPYIQSPYFSTKSRYTAYNISMKVYSESGSADAYLEFSSSENNKEAAGLLLQGNGKVGFYGINGTSGYWTSSSDNQITDQWVDVNIAISNENGGTISYEYGPDISRTFTGNGNYYPKIFYLVLLDQSNSGVYVDDIQITAEDLYGPALSISDDQMTIRPAEKDTMTVTFYGNGYDEGIYDGNIYLETNDPNNESLTIPIDLHIDPNNQHSNDAFAIELTGEEGFRLLSAPTAVNLMEFLEPLHTQGAANADASAGSPNVWTWNKDFTGSSNAGWNSVADLDTTINSGDAFLVYVFTEDVYGDSSSREFPKLLQLSGPLVSSADPTVNQNTDGFTFVGNPFPATVDWDDVFANSGSSELSSSIHTYDPNRMGWISYNSSLGTGDITNGLIKPFQGFFVRSSSSTSNAPSLSFEADDVVSGGEYYGKSPDRKFARFEISDIHSNTSNSAFTVFTEQGTLNKDELDALEMTPLPGKSLSLSTKSADGFDFDINALPNLEDSFRIPLTIQSQHVDRVTFMLTDKSGLSDVDIQLSNGEWTQEVRLNEKIALNIAALEKTKSGKLLQKYSNAPLNPYELIFTKRKTVHLDESMLPKTFELQQNFPNPFNPTTTIGFGLPTSSRVKLSIFNVLGQEVKVLVDEPKQAGYHTIIFDATNLSSGVYLYRIEANSFIETQKMILLK